MSRESDLQSLYEGKARAELDAADGLVPGLEGPRATGTVFARVLVVKGVPGDADLSTGLALAGLDGEAVRKALDVLGLDRESVFATVSRPLGERNDAILRRLALQIEAVDPEIVIALDGSAAEDLATVAGQESLPFGAVTTWHGRRLLAVDGLEASLGDERRKRTVWEQLRRLARE